MKKFWILLGAALLSTGLYLFCKTQTHGFKFYYILSDLPNDPRWEMPPLSTEEMTHVQKLLDQPFTFLGRGGWCFAFLGADQKTVLKFFKHTHFSLANTLRGLSFGKLLFQSPTLPSSAHYFQEFNFTSCKLLYEMLPERTGLIYVHLNKTEGLHPTVTLYDPIGVRQTIALDKTEFVLQHRAELLFPHLDRLVAQGELKEAKQAIASMLDCILAIYGNGIKDIDEKLYENFGYINNEAITVDLSSFVPDEKMKRPAVYKRELIAKTLRLGRWLRKHHPELHSYYEEKLNALMERGSEPQTASDRIP